MRLWHRVGNPGRAWWCPWVGETELESREALWLSFPSQSMRGKALCRRRPLEGRPSVSECWSVGACEEMSRGHGKTRRVKRSLSLHGACSHQESSVCSNWHDWKNLIIHREPLVAFWSLSKGESFTIYMCFIVPSNNLKSRSWNKLFPCKLTASLNKS